MVVTATSFTELTIVELTSAAPLMVDVMPPLTPFTTLDRSLIAINYISNRLVFVIT
jgi:hypothetical protein